MWGSLFLENIDSTFFQDLEYYLKSDFVPIPKILAFDINLKGDYSFLKEKLGLQSPAIFHLRRDGQSRIFSHPNVYWDEMHQSTVVPSTVNTNYEAFPPTLSIAMFPSDKPKERARFEGIINSINEKIKNDINQIYYVPALRGFDTYEYNLLQKSSKLLINPENFRSQSERLATSIAYSQDVCEKVSSVVSDILDRKVRFRVVEGPAVLAEIHNGKKWVNLFNEGFGLNPLIHLIFQVLEAKAGSLVLIEEPEIHLHPSAQSKLASILIQLCLPEGKRLIMTTHSEHIIFGFLEAVRDKKIDGSRARVHYFDYSESQTIIESIKVKNDGTLDGGLKGFFETDLGHLQKFYEQMGGGNESNS